MMTSGIPAEVIGHLRCPNCGESLEKAGGSLRCARGHNHDIARQGYGITSGEWTGFHYAAASSLILTSSYSAGLW